MNNDDIKEVIEFINRGVNGNDFQELSSNMVHHDPYLVLADYADYHKVRQEMVEAYADRSRWNRMSLMNVAGAGFFSADRAIEDYARDIWHCKPMRK